MAATGIAAAYLDVIAVVTIYKWVAAPVGLVLAAIVGGAGLALARRWDSEHLALLVLVPLIALAPEITRGVDLLLIGFMLALSAAALPVQLGKDWLRMHAARIAATTLPLLVALPGAARTTTRGCSAVRARWPRSWRWPAVSSCCRPRRTQVDWRC